MKIKRRDFIGSAGITGLGLLAGCKTANGAIRRPNVVYVFADQWRASAMGYAGINEVFGPIVLRQLTCYIEDHEYEAVPLPNIYLRPNVNHNGPWDPPRSMPVRPGLPEPDVMIDLRIAAFAAGMGEIGWSKVLLTPEFGPMQRFVALLTDFEFEPDPIFEGSICDRCMLCAKGCTGNAISTTESDSITVAGHTCEFAKIDLGACGRAYRGGNEEYNPFLMDGQKIEDCPDGRPIPLYMRHNSALEGAKGCMRECYIHLEKAGLLKKKFSSPFRKRKPWKLNRGQEDPEAEYTQQETGVILF